MREIKFRAWDETNKVMENNVNVNQGEAVKRGYQWYSPANTVRDSKLMQYTGLKDKNGIEIYEGDIVHHHYSFEAQSVDGPLEGEDEIVGTVKIDGYGVLTETESAPYYWIDYLEESTAQLEVLGNIFQDPEILEEVNTKNKPYADCVEFGEIDVFNTQCSLCGIEISFEESYKSRKSYIPGGWSYTVCKSCYEEERADQPEGILP